MDDVSINKFVNLWIDISLSDLKSAKILYEEKQHRTSYFMFQQATEKANKAFGFFSGKFTEKDIRNIQHDQFKIYRKLINNHESENQEALQNFALFPQIENSEILPHTEIIKYSKSISDGKRFIDGLKDRDLVNISLLDLNEFLRKLREIKTVKLNIPKNHRKQFENQMYKLADWIGEFQTLKAYETKKEYLETLGDKERLDELYNIVIQQMLLINEFGFISLTLYYCALITIQHSSLTRYPDERGNNPDKIYKKSLPIIRKQREFMDLLEGALNKMKKVL